MGSSPQKTHQIPHSPQTPRTHTSAKRFDAFEAFLKWFLFSVLINKGILQALEAISGVLRWRCGPDGD